MSGTIGDLGAIIFTVIFLFGFGCILGWCIELLFRRFISSKNPERKWINPGFLVGPWLPLYGFGLASLYFMSFIPFIGIKSLDEITVGSVISAIIVMGLLMTLIEYIAGLIFIKGMHIKLWDYSNKKGNIQGIICPQFTVIWILLAGVYYFFIQPGIIGLVIWFYEHIWFIFVVGAFAGVFLVDLCYSLYVMGYISKYGKDENCTIKYQELQAAMRAVDDKNKKAFRFSFNSKDKHEIKEHLKDVSEKRD